MSKNSHAIKAFVKFMRQRGCLVVGPSKAIEDYNTLLQNNGIELLLMTPEREAEARDMLAEILRASNERAGIMSMTISTSNSKLINVVVKG